jgi:ABC-2 type transport system permease protein
LVQLRHDHRSVAILIVVPCLVFGLIAWMFDDSPTPVIDTFGPMLIGVFPAVVMFLITSVATLRERSSGTLERLMAMPMGKADFLLGYAIAFAVAAAIQATVLLGFAIWVCGMKVNGSIAVMALVAILDAVLGSSLGLAASAFARTEFQAVQFMPIMLLPQFVLCGLVMPRAAMPVALEAISRAAPFSYAISAVQSVAGGGQIGDVADEIGVIVAFIVGSLILGVATLRRRTR